MTSAVRGTAWHRLHNLCKFASGSGPANPSTQRRRGCTISYSQQCSPVAQTLQASSTLHRTIIRVIFFNQLFHLTLKLSIQPGKRREHCAHSLFHSPVFTHLLFSKVGVKVKKKSKPCEILGLKPVTGSVDGDHHWFWPQPCSYPFRVGLSNTGLWY